VAVAAAGALAVGARDPGEAEPLSIRQCDDPGHLARSHGADLALEARPGLAGTGTQAALGPADRQPGLCGHRAEQLEQYPVEPAGLGVGAVGADQARG